MLYMYELASYNVETGEHNKEYKLAFKRIAMISRNSRRFGQEKKKTGSEGSREARALDYEVMITSTPNRVLFSCRKRLRVYYERGKAERTHTSLSFFLDGGKCFWMGIVQRSATS